MGVCAEGGRWQLALKLLGETRRNFLDVDSAGYGAVLSACCAVDPCGPHGEEPCTELGTDDDGLSVGNATGLPGWERALELLEKFRHRGLVPDVKGYAAAAHACMRANRLVTAHSLLWEMRHHGARSTAAVDCEPAFGVCAVVKGGWRCALGLLEDARKWTLEPGAAGYAAVIEACDHGGQLHSALQLLDEIRWRKLDPDATSYGFGLRAAATSTKLSGWAPEILDEMTRRGLRLDALSCRAALRALERGARWQRALELLTNTHEHGPKPDRYCYQAAISACAKRRHWGVAQMLFEALIRLLEGDGALGGVHPLELGHRLKNSKF